MARIRQCVQMDKDLQKQIHDRLHQLAGQGMDIKYSQFLRDCVKYCIKTGKPHDEQLELALGGRSDVGVIDTILRG